MSNHVAAAPEWLTPEYIENMLRGFFKDDSLLVGKFQVQPGSSVGDNYVSQIFRVNVDYSRQNQQQSICIIAKVMPNTDLSKEMNKGIDFFKVEKLMLTETLTLMYEKLLEHNENERFFPFLYNLDIDNKMIFMEDLKAEGYQMVDRKTPLDLEHSLLVIKSLAKMHAAGYLLLKENPAYKEKYLDYLWRKEKEENLMFKLVEGSLTCLVNSLDVWPISEEDKNVFRNFRGNLYEKLADNYSRKETSFNVLLHGDCWLNNIMFKYENEKLTSVKLIDYQICNYNSIGLDLNYFIFTSTKNDVKIKYLEEIFKTYYETFIGIAGEVKGFNIDVIRKEFIEKLVFGFVCAAIFRGGVLASKPFDLDAYAAGQDSPSNLQAYQNEKYIEEIVELLPLFKKHGIFK